MARKKYPFNQAWNKGIGIVIFLLIMAAILPSAIGGFYDPFTETQTVEVIDGNPYSIDDLIVGNQTTGADDVGISEGLAVSDDGTQVFIALSDNDIDIYTLSEPYDFETNTQDETFDIGFDIHNLQFAENGDKVYIFNADDENITEYELSTPYDLDTRTPTANISLGEITNTHFYITNNGEYLYVYPHSTSDTILAYNMDSFDLSTASIDGESDGFEDYESFVLNDDGTQVQFINNTDFFVGNLSTPYDIETLEEINHVSSLEAESGDQGSSLQWVDDGNRLFVLLDDFNDHDAIKQYDATSITEEEQLVMNEGRVLYSLIGLIFIVAFVIFLLRESILNYMN